MFFSNLSGHRNCDAGIAIAVPANTSGHCNCGAGVAIAAPTRLFNTGQHSLYHLYYYLDYGNQFSLENPQLQSYHIVIQSLCDGRNRQYQSKIMNIQTIFHKIDKNYLIIVCMVKS